MEIDRNGLEVLSREECLRLLGTVTLGRIGIQSRALPVVLPVNFVVDAEEIVIRTGAGSKLDAAARNAVVAFEADAIDALYHTGWSVTMTGIAREVVELAKVAHMKKLPLAHWARGDADRYIAISTELVSGRRITQEGFALQSCGADGQSRLGSTASLG